MEIGDADVHAIQIDGREIIQYQRAAWERRHAVRVLGGRGAESNVRAGAKEIVAIGVRKQPVCPYPRCPAGKA